jgi:hypothetical protein
MGLLGPLGRTEVILTSPLAPHEVVRELGARIDPDVRRIIWPWERVTKPFRGRIEGRRFQVVRTSKLWKPAALPLIDGAIEPRGDGSAIRLDFHGHLATRLMIGMGILGGSFISLFAIHGIFTIGVPDPFLLLPVVFTVLYGWSATSWFRKEMRRAIRIFAPLGEPEPEQARSLVRE